MQSMVQWDRFTNSKSSFRFGKGEWENSSLEKPLGAREEWLSEFLLLCSEPCQVNATQKHCPSHIQGSEAADAWRWTWSWSCEMKCIRKCFPFPSPLKFLLWKEDFSFPHVFSHQEYIHNYLICNTALLFQIHMQSFTSDDSLQASQDRDFFFFFNVDHF